MHTGETVTDLGPCQAVARGGCSQGSMRGCLSATWLEQATLHAMLRWGSALYLPCSKPSPRSVSADLTADLRERGCLGPSFASSGAGWGSGPRVGGCRAGPLKTMSTPLSKLEGSKHVSLCLLAARKRTLPTKMTLSAALAAGGGACLCHGAVAAALPPPGAPVSGSQKQAPLTASLTSPPDCSVLPFKRRTLTASPYFPSCSALSLSTPPRYRFFTWKLFVLLSATTGS